MKIVNKNGRYFVVDDNDENKIIDNTNGRGYKTEHGAMVCYNTYINRDISKYDHQHDVVFWAEENKKLIRKIDKAFPDAKKQYVNTKKPRFTVKDIIPIIRAHDVPLPENISYDDVYEYIISSRKPRYIKKNQYKYAIFSRRGRTFTDEEDAIIKKYNTLAGQINNAKYFDEKTQKLVESIKELRPHIVEYKSRPRKL